MVLISGSGTNMAAVIQRSLAGDRPYEVVKVISDRPAGGMAKAAALGIPAVMIDRSKGSFHEDLLKETKGADFIVLAGFLSILEPRFIRRFSGRILNIHPSLLPKYGGLGMHGLNVHAAVLAAGERESGCSCHIVTEEVDGGPVLIQRKVLVGPTDTPETLQKRILAEEHLCLSEGLIKLIEQKKGVHMNALLSVYDKEGILELAEYLIGQGFTIISSGGTCDYLLKHGIAARSVESVTGSREILGGRVKTLHPRIHGGILARRDDRDHLHSLKEQGIDTIDLVCVNLYPFEEKRREDLAFDELIEFIDIGGPSMLRSAAKNHAGVFVLSDPSQYAEFKERFSRETDQTSYRRHLALAAFKRTAAYDQAIAEWLEQELSSPISDLNQPLIDNDPFAGNEGYFPENRFPEKRKVQLVKVEDLRYGENPHQKSSFYRLEGQEGFMTSFIQHHGKAMGYINYKDLESAWRIVCDFETTCCAAVKHNTPSGVATGKDAEDAYKRAHSCDPLSIFGGIVAVNTPVDGPCARKMTETMLHIVCAPAFTEEALSILKKKKNLIVIEMREKPGDELNFISSGGGVLIQEEDDLLYSKLQTVTLREPSEEELAELLFAMKVVKFTKSNAIVVSRDEMALGIGGGFVNRVDAAGYALERGNGATCLASDAFFPFSDVVEVAHRHGIRAIIQPGGSVNDQLSIDRCNELGIAMVFTSTRHFRH